MSIYRKELQILLEESDQYNPSSLLSKINENLIEERLILYRKAHDYGGCLNLLTSLSSGLSFEKIVEFCDKSYSKSRDEGRKLYTEYLQRLSKQNQHDLVIKLLNMRGSLMDIGTAIVNIPKWVKSGEIKEFLKGIVHETEETQRIITRNRFLKQLLAEKKKQIAYLKSGFVQIEDDTRCVQCGNRIGPKFILKPNNDILDFICDEM